MINDSFYVGSANIWVFFLFIGCFVCLGIAIGIKMDRRERWKLIAYAIAAAVLAFIAVCIIVFHLS